MWGRRHIGQWTHWAREIIGSWTHQAVGALGHGHTGMFLLRREGISHFSVCHTYLPISILFFFGLIVLPAACVAMKIYCQRK